MRAGRSSCRRRPAQGKPTCSRAAFYAFCARSTNPGQVVAITFTKAAAAEMRHRILSELERSANQVGPKSTADDFSMESLAGRALQRSHALGWDLINLPAQLRISTIDSFCREIGLQEPLLSGLGGGLDITENPSALYHRAARHTLEQIAAAGPEAPVVVPEIERLLLWRDNGWQEMESLLVDMLRQRDRWMQDFVLSREPNWDALRERLERPFARAVAEGLAKLDQLLDQETRDEAMELARFACGQRNSWLQCKLFTFVGLPCAPFVRPEALDEARQGYLCLADLLLTGEGNLRQRITVTNGFPVHRREEKGRVLELIARLRAIPEFEVTLAAVRDLPPARYSEEDWQIVRSCFTMLRHSVGELQVAFAETGVVDFTEVAQIAQRVLTGPDGAPTDAALAIADGIHHLLVDEFQDTSRRQHRLIASLVAAWPDRHGRSLFVVGDPMQSIYFFRDADAELFPRVRAAGLELPDGDRLELDYVPLTSNFRTEPRLVQVLNSAFTQIFDQDDGSGVRFAAAEPARSPAPDRDLRFHLHVDFMPQTAWNVGTGAITATDRKQAVMEQRETAREKQVGEIVALIRTHMKRAQSAAKRGEKYRIAVLGRTRSALAPIAQALRDADILFRAVDLETLSERSEVLDALALARALLDPEDRVAWLGALRAPWCGLSLTDLHVLASNDDPELLRHPVISLLTDRLVMLSEGGRRSAGRLVEMEREVSRLRAANPSISIGTWLEQAWLQMGGRDCTDATAQANLSLLWSCLDKLEGGEPDLLGAGLDAALEALTAQPDPDTDSNNGVQLMTIHKSKGLEFEVVIVPELQQRCGQGRGGLLSWLERGLAEPDDSGDLTEFLVAPIGAKGAEGSSTKSWVGRCYRERESQEMRRILYVAATRAREALHLFARPEYKTEGDGSMTLCEPRGGLLVTGWPAFEEEIQNTFQTWSARPHMSDIGAMAASAQGNLFAMDRPSKAAIVRRLPLDYRAPKVHAALLRREASSKGLDVADLYERHEGGERSRALGVAVHMLFEQLAQIHTSEDWAAACEKLPLHLPRVQTQLRSSGLRKDEAAEVAAEALEITLVASNDDEARWILSPHRDAANEVRWAGVLESKVYEVRVDRVFRAGALPRSSGDDCWWIVDYKTAQRDKSELVALRALFARQLLRYAEVLRNLHGSDVPVRAALYYPRMRTMDWWEL